ncbi:MAG: LysE family transporter [Eubacteriales bacterium]
MFFLFMSALTVGFSGAMMPGSLLTYTIQQSLKTGAHAGLLITVGHAILEACLILLIFLGLGSILKAEIAQIIVGLAGGALLAAMGIQMIAGSIRNTVHIGMAEEQAKVKNAKLILSGAVISATNPYFLLWWMVIGLGFIMQSYNTLGTAGVAVYYFGHITADFIWYVSISAAIGRTRKFIKETPYRIILAALGCLLVYFGVTFIAGAIALIKQ